MSWFRKRKHQFRGVLAFLHPQFLHYSQLAVVLEAHRFPSRHITQWLPVRCRYAARTSAEDTSPSGYPLDAGTLREPRLAPCG